MITDYQNTIRFNPIGATNTVELIRADGNALQGSFMPSHTPESSFSADLSQGGL